MEEVASRHASDLDGRLLALVDAPPVAVTIEVAPEVAHLAAVQHTLWMTVNMLARLQGVVAEVRIACPDDVAMSGRVAPLARRDLPLLNAVLEGGAAIGTVPVAAGAELGDSFRLVIGPGAAVSDGLRVYGEAWSGGAARGHEIRSIGPSQLPFGPYLAASIAVAEIFKLVRMHPTHYVPLDAAFYSAWSHSAGPELEDSGPSGVGGAVLDEAIAGIGAVGCIAVHALWATPDLSGEITLADADERGVDITNLNRYLLFGVAHLGQMKAATAQEIAADAEIKWKAVDKRLELGGPYRRVLCAVDTNDSRAAIQSTYPTLLLMASTKDLRAEIVRCDPRSGGPCARCYNDPEARTSDQAFREEFLSAATERQTELAVQVGASVEDALTWAETGECGTAGERVLHFMRESESRVPLFAVPFTSCAAGTLLAAEAVKEALDAPVPLSPSASRAYIQFWTTERSRGAHRYPRSSRCPMCAPGSDGADVWKARTVGLSWRGERAQRA